MKPTLIAALFVVSILFSQSSTSQVDERLLQQTSQQSFCIEMAMIYGTVYQQLAATTKTPNVPISGVALSNEMLKQAEEVNVDHSILSFIKMINESLLDVPDVQSPQSVAVYVLVTCNSTISM